MTGTVRMERAGHVATLTIDRPEKLNALTAAMRDEVSARLREIDEDDGIWVAVVTGAGGRSFSVGADIVEEGEHAGHAGAAWSPVRPLAYDGGLEVRKPLIAAISGHCLAAGLELALACDIRIASEDASFGAPEVRWGLLHTYGALRLPVLVGRGEALSLLLTGDPIDAGRAERIGLIQEVVPPGAVLARAHELAERICRNSPLAVRVTKELVLRGDTMSLDDGVRYAASLAQLLDASDDVREGTEAFAEKRQPRFTGR